MLTELLTGSTSAWYQVPRTPVATVHKVLAWMEEETVMTALSQWTAEPLKSVLSFLPEREMQAMTDQLANRV